MGGKQLVWHRTRPGTEQLQRALSDMQFWGKPCLMSEAFRHAHPKKKKRQKSICLTCDASIAVHHGINFLFWRQSCLQWAWSPLCGTALNQKLDNFQAPFLSCCKQRCCSIICPALVFVGTGLNQKSDDFNVPFLSCCQ